MASLGVVPFTPWSTERECSEEDLAKLIAELVESLPGDRQVIMNFHCPPYGTGLDDAPELDATLKPVIRGGRPSIVPVGSHAVRDAIKKYQPPVSLHGHIHESRGVQRIGRTLCVNPGSDYSSGVLRGAVVDIAEDGTCLDFLLTTG
jgi:Icc-related predicted phosphoesterase